MKSKNSFNLHKFNKFTPYMVHEAFPNINAIKLEESTITGWTYRANIGPYTVNAGYADKAMLYEGTYNTDMLHISFILNQGQTAVVEAHTYNDSSLEVDYGSVPLHEIFPANMSWVNIYAPKEIMMNGIDFPSENFITTPHMVTSGGRDDLAPLIRIINNLLELKPNTIIKKNIEMKIQKEIEKLLSIRMNSDYQEQPFITGDKFKMQILEKTHKLADKYKDKHISLDEICQAVKMKPRTVQKYFNEIYGMGPTEYFRIRRLNSAHIDLLKGGDDVSEIALRWKFAHLGRFAKTYKNFFGENPSVIMRRQS